MASAIYYGAGRDAPKLGMSLHNRKNLPTQAGKIKFDDRGNAIYEWQAEEFTGDGFDAEQLRAAALAHPGLAIIDDAPAPHGMVRRNSRGLRIGYDPYDSGQLDKPGRRKTRDLRRLSRWIELRKSTTTREE